VVQQLTVTAVICACTHLTMFAVSLRGNYVLDALPSPTPAVNMSTPRVVGIARVAFNLTGAFGSVSRRMHPCVQKQAEMRSVLTQSILFRPHSV
jgi:hypothetical protein